MRNHQPTPGHAGAPSRLARYSTIGPDSLNLPKARHRRPRRNSFVPTIAVEPLQASRALRGTGPAPLDVFGGAGSAEPVLRSQGTLGQVELSRCARRGSGCRRSYARSGPVPLRPHGRGRGRSHLFTQKGTLFTLLMSLLGLRGTGPALSAASWRRTEALGM